MKSQIESSNWTPRYLQVLKEFGKEAYNLPLPVYSLINTFENTRNNLLNQPQDVINRWIKILAKTDAVICDEIEREFSDLPKVKTQTTINQDKLLALKAKARKFR